MSRRLIRSVVAASVLAGLASLTKPTRSSFPRALGALAKGEAGGGLMGWAAAKLTELGINAAGAVNAYVFEDYWVAILVRVTQSGSTLSGGEVDDWVFVGLFGMWIAVKRQKGCGSPYGIVDIRLLREDSSDR